MRSTLYLAQARLLRHGIPVPSGGATTPDVPADGAPSVYWTEQTPHGLALLIAQSLEYFVHPDMGLLGTDFVGFPLAVAQGYFEHFGAREALWFSVIFARMREMQSGLGEFLDEMYKGEGVVLVRP